MRIHKLGLAAFAAPLLVGFLSFSAMAQNNQGQNNNNQGQNGGRGSTSTPAPIAGIGLVSLSGAGAALYWVARRFRRRDED
jgi:hypothetical protein